MCVYAELMVEKEVKVDGDDEDQRQFLLLLLLSLITISECLHVVNTQCCSTLLTC